MKKKLIPSSGKNQASQHRMLVFAYARKREDAAKPGNDGFPGMVISDEEVLEAWKKIRPMLLVDNKD